MVITLNKESVDAEIDYMAKSLNDGLIRMKLNEARIERTLLDYVTKDIVDSYDKLIAQRKECSDKLINYYKIFLGNDADVDVVEIYKVIAKRQEQEIKYWNNEIKLIKDIKKDSDGFSDDTKASKKKNLCVREKPFNCVQINNFNFPENEEFARFRLYDAKTDECVSDQLETHYINIKEIPKD